VASFRRATITDEHLVLQLPEPGYQFLLMREPPGVFVTRPVLSVFLHGEGIAPLAGSPDEHIIGVLSPPSRCVLDVDYLGCHYEKRNFRRVKIAHAIPKTIVTPIVQVAKIMFCSRKVILFSLQRESKYSPLGLDFVAFVLWKVPFGFDSLRFHE
jgi:hypothetical protein